MAFYKAGSDGLCCTQRMALHGFLLSGTGDLNSGCSLDVGRIGRFQSSDTDGNFAVAPRHRIQIFECVGVSSSNGACFESVVPVR